jgi:hypothetical protein
MVIGADHVRLGGMIDRLEQAYSVGSNIYPQTLKNAKLYLERTNDSNKKSIVAKTTPSDTCTTPMPPVPKKAPDISADEAVELSFTTIPTCNVCGKKGHRTAVCFQKKRIPQKDWYVNQQQQQQQDEAPPADGKCFAQAPAFYDL